MDTSSSLIGALSRALGNLVTSYSLDGEHTKIYLARYITGEELGMIKAYLKSLPRGSASLNKRNRVITVKAPISL